MESDFGARSGQGERDEELVELRRGHLADERPGHV